MLVLSAPSNSNLSETTKSLNIGHAHLVGIGGMGMKALATVLEMQGWQITGSDLCVEPSSRFHVELGHSADHVLAMPDLVVYSPAIHADNIELAVARRIGVPAISYPEMLGRLMGTQRGMAVAGTHGKSTTVAMTANILEAARLDATVIVGADSVDGRSISRSGRGSHMLVEACEYRSSFLNLRPEVAVILGIEADHFDYFTSFEHLERVFTDFVELLPSDGTVFVRSDCLTSIRVARAGKARAVTFGLDCDADWQAQIVSIDRGRHRFDILNRGRWVTTTSLQVPGHHNVINAIAAAALADDAGASPEAIRQGLETFSGLRRRLEIVGTARGVMIVDDYAHHPTEITAALAAVRQMRPDGRICCVFEPHQASRTKSLLDELAFSLQNADTLAVVDIFRAREPAWQRGEITSADLAARIERYGKYVAPTHRAQEIEDWIIDQWRNGALADGDTVVTLGAGTIGSLANGVYNRIRKDCTSE